jgi:hypothetical protein
VLVIRPLAQRLQPDQQQKIISETTIRDLIMRERAATAMSRNIKTLTQVDQEFHAVKEGVSNVMAATLEAASLLTKLAEQKVLH